jgi:hypothetical protein
MNSDFTCCINYVEGWTGVAAENILCVRASKQAAALELEAWADVVIINGPSPYLTRRVYNENRVVITKNKLIVWAAG